MKKNSGFSIMELLLAVSLSTMVIGIVTYLIHNFFSETKSMETWSSGQLEMSMALKTIEGDIRNVIRMDPVENLTSSSSVEYFGMTSLSPGMEPSICLNQDGASVIRYTTLDRKQRSERVLRAWSEMADANKTGNAHELRLTADETEASMFNASKMPVEVVLVDADRRYLRRYTVVSKRMNLSSNLDPYDDLPKTDSFGAPIIFKFASAILRTPANVGGSAIISKTAVFITGTEVYSSRTYSLCLRKSDRSLIRYDENTREETVLLQNPHVDFTIESFRVGYMATRAGLRVEPASFLPEMLNLPNLECINTVMFTLNLNASDSLLKRNQSQAVGELKTQIMRQRTVYSQNLSIKRPLSCQ
ncbi:type II secretion system protein J [Bdellovibrio bacteriovorus]|uniref:PulJ/GspJ family protein n=1 Tax=Bdellovibrio bacteriovorus TaxID=959 RepID=UPI0035A711DC